MAAVLHDHEAMMVLFGRVLGMAPMPTAFQPNPDGFCAAWHREPGAFDPPFWSAGVFAEFVTGHSRHTTGRDGTSRDRGA
jgi:hypothetical protein